MRNIISLIAVFVFGFASAQELNCTVTVNADQLGGTNVSVYKTLQRSLTDFINKTDWTGQGYKPNERINCSMYITISAGTAGQYTATIQVQSSRPVYNSTYESPVFNYNDKDFVFEYTEFQPLVFNPTTFDSNLISVISFYSFMIIGMDADTFSPNGGQTYLETAQDIASTAQTGGYKGWSGSDGTANRFFLINDMLSSTYSGYRDAMYEYHFEGMDAMARDQKGAKEKIKEAVSKLADVHSTRPNSFIMRVFFDAKADELVSVFSGGPQVSIIDLSDNLNRFSPLNGSKWSKIKF